MNDDPQNTPIPHWSENLELWDGYDPGPPMENNPIKIDWPRLHPRSVGQAESATQPGGSADWLTSPAREERRVA